MKLPILPPANFSSLLKEVIFLKDNPTTSPQVIQKILDGGYSVFCLQTEMVSSRRQ